MHLTKHSRVVLMKVLFCAFTEGTRLRISHFYYRFYYRGSIKRESCLKEHFILFYDVSAIHSGSECHGLECEWFWYVQLELHIFHMQAWSECYNDTRMQSYNQPSENLRSCLKVIFARRFLSIPCSDCTAYSLQNKRWQKLEGLSKREKEKKETKTVKTINFT